MNWKSYAFFGIIAIVFIAGVFNDDGKKGDLAPTDIDLNRLLDVSLQSISRFEGKMSLAKDSLDGDSAFIMFAEQYSTDLNALQPPIHKKTLGVQPNNDASLLGYEDLNANGELDDGEDGIFLLEIDGQNSRIIATAASGARYDSSVPPGTGFLAGYLIGSMLDRQRAFGNPSAVASKTRQTASQARSARSRAGSGSHSVGK